MLHTVYRIAVLIKLIWTKVKPSQHMFLTKTPVFVSKPRDKPHYVGLTCWRIDCMDRLTWKWPKTQTITVSKIEFINIKKLLMNQQNFWLKDISTVLYWWGRQVGELMMATLMLVTDVGDSFCWWHLWDASVRFFALKSHQHNDSATKILKLTQW